MSDCAKKFGPRRLACVKPAGHEGRHTHIRSARGIGIELRRLRRKGCFAVMIRNSVVVECDTCTSALPQRFETHARAEKVAMDLRWRLSGVGSVKVTCPGCQADEKPS